MAAMETKQGLPVIVFETAQDCREWFARNHLSSAGFWLKIGKKGNPAPSVSYAEAVDEALCYGWIDSQKAAFDGHWSLQRFTPRTKKSPWSQINREKVARLIAEGRMTTAGLAAIDSARADGRWERAYSSQSRAEVPPDLQLALDENPDAAEFFATLTASIRYAVLYRIQDAKRPETRARRIAESVERLARREPPRMWQASPPNTGA